VLAEGKQKEGSKLKEKHERCPGRLGRFRLSLWKRKKERERKSIKEGERRLRLHAKIRGTTVDDLRNVKARAGVQEKRLGKGRVMPLKR